LLRLITGLLVPEKGSVLVDRVDLRQVNLKWWRAQFVYLPQEPTFLPATIKEAISIANPDISDENLHSLLDKAGLTEYLNNSAKGLETYLSEEGRNLPQGIRRRLALVRAMVNNGRLVILDEPTEGLDEEGCQTVYGLLNEYAQNKSTTLIVVTRDPKILKGATHTLSLDTKPIPKITLTS